MTCNPLSLFSKQTILIFKFTVAFGQINTSNLHAEAHEDN